MNKFELCGIKSPGTINLPNLGTIDLDKIDDDLAEKLWRDGLPYLKPKSVFLKEVYPDKHIAPQTLKRTKKTARQ